MIYDNNPILIDFPSRKLFGLNIQNYDGRYANIVIELRETHILLLMNIYLVMFIE